jgi:DNA polymerase III epsilon subunit family exonuclease
MTDFDQLGLFSTSQAKAGKAFGQRPTTVSLNVEFSDGQKADELIEKITKDIEKFDSLAKISATKTTQNSWQDEPFLAIDVETTGLDAAGNRVIELAMIPFNMPHEQAFSSLFSHDAPLPPEIISITGITDEMLLDKPRFKEHAKVCIALMKKASFVVAYNAKFDRPFLESEFARLDLVMPKVSWVDPFIFICEIDRYKRGKKLTDAASRWGVELKNAHRASSDAEACGKLLLKLAEKIDCHTLDELLDKQMLFHWRNEHNRVEMKKANPWNSNR